MYQSHSFQKFETTRNLTDEEKVIKYGHTLFNLPALKKELGRQKTGAEHERVIVMS